MSKKKSELQEKMRRQYAKAIEPCFRQSELTTKLDVMSDEEVAVHYFKLGPDVLLTVYRVIWDLPWGDAKAGHNDNSEGIQILVYVQVMSELGLTLYRLRPTEAAAIVAKLVSSFLGCAEPPGYLAERGMSVYGLDADIDGDTLSFTFRYYRGNPPDELKQLLDSVNHITPEDIQKKADNTGDIYIVSSKDQRIIARPSPHSKN